MLYYIIPYYTILHYIMLYYIAIYHMILYDVPLQGLRAALVAVTLIIAITNSY